MLTGPRRAGKTVLLQKVFPDASYQKAQVNRGERRQLWHCRDHAGLEVDFVLPGRGGALVAGLTAG